MSSQSMRGQHRRHRAFLTLSEVIGHLDLLKAEGRIRKAETDGVVPFEDEGRLTSGEPIRRAPTNRSR